MQDAGLNSNFSSNSINPNVAAQSGQVAPNGMNVQTQSQQTTSIFGDKNNKANSNINQSNSNSQGTGGLGTIFNGGNFATPANDTTSIFAGIRRGSNYSLYSKKDVNYDFHKLTQEDIASQKGLTGPKRTNPKANNIDLTSKQNPYEAFRNPEMQEPNLSETFNQLGSKISNMFTLKNNKVANNEPASKNIFNQKKAN